VKQSCTPLAFTLITAAFAPTALSIRTADAAHHRRQGIIRCRTFALSPIPTAVLGLYLHCRTHSVKFPKWHYSGGGPGKNGEHRKYTEMCIEPNTE